MAIKKETGKIFKKDKNLDKLKADLQSLFRGHSRWMELLSGMLDYSRTNLEYNLKGAHISELVHRKFCDLFIDNGTIKSFDEYIEKYLEGNIVETAMLKSASLNVGK